MINVFVSNVYVYKEIKKMCFYRLRLKKIFKEWTKNMFVY